MPETNRIDSVMLDREFLVVHKNDATRIMDRPHFHDGCEIHFTVNNSVFYYVDGRKYEGKQGTVAIFNSQEIHRVVSKEAGNYERFYILFKPSFLEYAVSSYPNLLHIFTQRSENFENVIQLKIQDFNRVLNLYRNLIDLQTDAQINMRDLKMHQNLIEIILILDDYYHTGQQIENRIAYRKDGELKNIIDYIKSNYNITLSLEDIAERFYISRSTLFRLFKDTMDMTPNEFISYVRIMESRKFLREGCSVKNVALKVGYADDSTFIKKFKKIQGISPKQYALKERKEMKK